MDEVSSRILYGLAPHAVFTLCVVYVLALKRNLADSLLTNLVAYYLPGADADTAAKSETYSTHKR